MPLVPVQKESPKLFAGAVDELKQKFYNPHDYRRGGELLMMFCFLLSRVQRGGYHVLLHAFYGMFQTLRMGPLTKTDVSLGKPPLMSSSLPNNLGFTEDCTLQKHVNQFQNGLSRPSAQHRGAYTKQTHTHGF